MEIKEAGFWTRGTITLPPSPHITAESLVQELSKAWGPRGFEAYKSSLVGVDVALKKSAWTGVAIKIEHNAQNTILRYNPFAPSALVRMLALGFIPLLIAYYNAWKPLLGEFRGYVEQSGFFKGQLGGGQAAPQLGN